MRENVKDTKAELQEGIFAIVQASFSPLLYSRSKFLNYWINPETTGLWLC